MPAPDTRVLLIDSATAGCAGAYVARIYESLDDRTSVEVGVNYHFPFAYGKRVFYKYSELAAQHTYKLGRLRLYVRFAELTVAFARLLTFIARRRVKIVCYAISSNLRLEYLFLYLARRLGAKVYLICHDVIPFISPGENYDRKVQKRRRFYELADRLIVHNDNSVSELVDVFGISPAKISRFPFPLYDLREMRIPIVDVLGKSANRRFLFIGHLRPEKGVDVLLEAWKAFHARNEHTELVIAGNIPKGCEYDFSALRDCNLTVLPNYLSDEVYVNLIRECDCVVLPYVRGTNSAVVSTVLALRRNLIVSDIGMFKNNPLIPAESFFRCNDSGSLVERLAHFASLTESDQLSLNGGREQRFAVYEAVFRREVNEVFSVNPPPGSDG